MDAMLLRQPLVLNFQIEIVFAENFPEISGSVSGGFILACHQVFGNFPGKTAGKSDQSLAMIGKKFLADARLVIEAVPRSLGSDLDEILITLFIFGEHEQVVVSVTFGRRPVIVFLADVELAADDRLDAGFLRLSCELDGSIDIAMIRHGDRLLAYLGDTF